MNKILVGVVIVLVLAGLVYVYVESPKQDDEQIACTMEALICPDGSGVGRSGPDCRFNACPNQEYWVGTLQQNENGFSLLLNTESSDTVPAEYTIPLEIRVSNVLQDFVGKEVRVIGTFKEGNTLMVENLEAVPVGN